MKPRGSLRSQAACFGRLADVFAPDLPMFACRHTLHVDFQMSHDFRALDHAGGVVDMALTPYRSPANALAGFRCANVSFTVRRHPCTTPCMQRTVQCGSGVARRVTHAALPAAASRTPCTGQVHNCSVVLRSPCLTAAFAKDGVTEMTLGWDGGDALQVVVVVSSSSWEY